MFRGLCYRSLIFVNPHMGGRGGGGGVVPLMYPQNSPSCGNPQKGYPDFRKPPQFASEHLFKGDPRGMTRSDGFGQETAAICRTAGATGAPPRGRCPGPKEPNTAKVRNRPY